VATTLEVLTASQIAMLLNPPMVNLQNTSFVLASSGSYSAIPWTAQLSKSGNITWSSGTNPSRITAVVPGTYLLTGTVIWPGGLASGDGRGQVQVNGSATDIRVTTMRGSVGNNGASVAGLQVLNAGDYVELAVNQSVASMTLICTFSVSLVSLATS